MIRLIWRYKEVKYAKILDIPRVHKGEEIFVFYSWCDNKAQKFSGKYMRVTHIRWMPNTEELIDKTPSVFLNNAESYELENYTG